MSPYIPHVTLEIKVHLKWGFVHMLHNSHDFVPNSFTEVCFFCTHMLCYFETTRESSFIPFPCLNVFLFQQKEACSSRCIILGNDHAIINLNKYWCWFVFCWYLLMIYVLWGWAYCSSNQKQLFENPYEEWRSQRVINNKKILNNIL